MTQKQLAIVEQEYDAEIAAYINGSDATEFHAALNARTLLAASAAAMGVTA